MGLCSSLKENKITHVILAIPEHRLGEADTAHHPSLRGEGNVRVDLRHQAKESHRPHAEETGKIAASTDTNTRERPTRSVIEEFRDRPDGFLKNEQKRRP